MFFDGTMDGVFPKTVEKNPLSNPSSQSEANAADSGSGSLASLQVLDGLLESKDGPDLKNKGSRMLS